jgi:YNFM family putative membrane transporter
MSPADPLRKALAGFMLGAAGMFATMYSTQAILPELSRDFGVSPSRAGLSISVVVLAVAIGGFAWGPVSDRIGRPRAIRMASLLLVPPTIGVAVAPGFEALLVCRTLQGLCMPGLLAVGAPYIVEAFVPRIGARAMGYYVSALVAGGLVGRLGVALASAVVGWRIAIGLLALLPLAAVVVMRRGLPEPERAPRRGGWKRHLGNARLLGVSVGGSALFFTFVGSFTFVTYRLEEPPFSYSLAAASLVFVLWLIGLAGPLAGRLADRVGWRRLALGTVALAAAGLLLTLPDVLPLVVLGLACIAGAMFTGYTATQLGVSDVAPVDRGAATALYFGIYYGGGALGAFLPGVAWQEWGWGGVAATGFVALGLAATGIASSRARGATPVTIRDASVLPPSS